jgi:hypothetical protein
MSQLLRCIEHLQTGALSMVTSVWGTENNHRGINQAPYPLTKTEKIPDTTICGKGYADSLLG